MIIDGKAEFWSVRKVEELRAEIDAMPFGQSEGSLNAQIQVEFAGTAQYSDAAVTEAGSVADCRNIGERCRIEIVVEPR